MNEINGRLYCGMYGWQAVCAKCEHKGFINNEKYMPRSEAEVWLRASGWIKNDLLWICPACAVKAVKMSELKAGPKVIYLQACDECFEDAYRAGELTWEVDNVSHQCAEFGEKPDMAYIRKDIYDDLLRRLREAAKEMNRLGVRRKEFIFYLRKHVPEAFEE